MNLYKIPRIERRSTSVFELAASVGFLSEIQHYVESPVGMSHVPEATKDFLIVLPDSWENIKYIEWGAGKLFVVASKSGAKWFMASVNAENIEKDLTLDLPFLANKMDELITSGEIMNNSLFTLSTMTL